MKVTYKLCLKLAELGKLTANMLDVYYAADRITDEQYAELITMITQEG